MKTESLSELEDKLWKLRKQYETYGSYLTEKADTLTDMQRNLFSLQLGSIASRMKEIEIKIKTIE